MAPAGLRGGHLQGEVTIASVGGQPHGVRPELYGVLGVRSVDKPPDQKKSIGARSLYGRAESTVLKKTSSISATVSGGNEST